MVMFLPCLSGIGFRICLLFNLAFTSSACLINLDQILNPLIQHDRIILKELDNMKSKVSDYDIKIFLKKHFNNVSKINFVLYPNFSFDAKYFDEILYKDNLTINIHYNDDLLALINRNETKSSEYINKFFKNLSNVQNITSLGLSNLKLTEIPKIIYNFKNLKVLNLRNNDLKDFAFEVNSISNLQELNISKNIGITKIDDSICDFSFLEILDASECSIMKISKFLNKLGSLEILDLKKNPIKSLPKDLSNLKNLTTLYISECSFDELTIDLLELPSLKVLDLNYNSSLKLLELLVPETSRTLKYLNILKCPSIKLEVFPNLKNLRILFFDYSQYEFHTVGIGDMFNLNELIFHYNFVKYGYKSYRFQNFNENNLPNRVDLSEFNFVIEENIISKEKLIKKWTKIYNRSIMKHKERLQDEYEHSIKFLNNLYEIQNDEYYADWIYFAHPDYKERMISILANLFDKLENIENSELQVKGILHILKRQQSEQLVYINYLLQSYNSDSSIEKKFYDFFKGSVQILKDYVFTICLNQEEYEESLKHLIITKSVGKFFIKQTSTNSPMKKEIITENNLKKKFDLKFTIDYVSTIIYNVINSKINSEMFETSVDYLLSNYEIYPEFFEYDNQENNTVIKGFSMEAIKYFISLIGCD